MRIVASPPLVFPSAAEGAVLVRQAEPPDVTEHARDNARVHGTA